jgi:glutamine amidotransferase
MCRHLAYLGPPIALRSLLFDAPHSLCEQAEHPDHQAPGRVNKDGWGVGWFATDGSVAGHYRTTTSMWDDRDMLSRTVESGAFVAAARLASPGAKLDSSGNAPYLADGRLFSLNGFVEEFRNGVEAELRAGLSARRRDAIVGDADTEVVFALVLDRLDAGDAPPQALAQAIARVRALSNAKLNLILADGREIHATRCGNSLFARPTTVVSEPLDAADDWCEVPDDSIVQIVGTGGSPPKVMAL